MSDWSTLRDGDLVQLGVLQIDIEGHSKLQGTDRSLKDTKAMLRRHADTSAKSFTNRVNARLKRQFEPYKFVGELNTQIYCTGPEMTGGNLQPDGSVRWPHLAAPGETVEVPDTVRNYCTLLAAGLS